MKATNNYDKTIRVTEVFICMEGIGLLWSSSPPNPRPAFALSGCRAHGFCGLVGSDLALGVFLVSRGADLDSLIR